MGPERFRHPSPRPSARTNEIPGIHVLIHCFLHPRYFKQAAACALFFFSAALSSARSPLCCVPPTASNRTRSVPPELKLTFCSSAFFSAFLPLVIAARGDVAQGRHGLNIQPRTRPHAMRALRVLDCACDDGGRICFLCENSEVYRGLHVLVHVPVVPYRYYWVFPKRKIYSARSS